MKNYRIISGCSGGGKSSILASLKSRGFRTVEEVGRRVVSSQDSETGRALPWKNMEFFLEKAIELARIDYENNRTSQDIVFFDRSLVDLVLAYSHFIGPSPFDSLLKSHLYAPQLFLTPPWPEIYVKDEARRHGFEQAQAEYHRLKFGYSSLGYQLIILPKSSVEARVNLILENI